jgi:hypothetical protein
MAQETFSLNDIRGRSASLYKLMSATGVDAFASNDKLIELVGKNGEVELYRDDRGVEYICDGADSYMERADEFEAIKQQYFS